MNDSEGVEVEAWAIKRACWWLPVTAMDGSEPLDDVKEDSLIHDIPHMEKVIITITPVRDSLGRRIRRKLK